MIPLKTKIPSLVFAITCLITSAPAASNISMNEAETARVQSGEIVVREIPSEKPVGLTIEVIGLMQAPANDLVQVLMDYENYHEFMPSTKRVEIVEQEGHEAVLNFILDPIMGIAKRHRIQINLLELDDSTSKLQWHLVEWPELEPKDTIKDTQGYWLIKQTSKRQSIVLYHVYTDPGPVPFGLQWVVGKLSKGSIEDAFTETKARVENLKP
ncbi:MAG: hypothetical protein HQ556_13420 [Candidatus Marinimicrobia bacterium]|nr:hypothetical protein [Candidatus Neomarinimicrobiota bacterium]